MTNLLSASAKPFDQVVEPPYLKPVGTGSPDTHGTTVLALKFEDGVLIFSDRRATMGNLIMYDQADKIMALDDATVVAISGSFARAVEVCRYLKHSFKYYRRAFLQELSVQGKLSEISKAIAGNAPMAMEGIGLFIPILAIYDAAKEKFGIFFFDGAGARFENPEYACAGSGSERIRGVFEYLTRTEGSFEKKSLEKVLEDGLRMLDIAADLDSATGGFNKVDPIVRVLDKQGNRSVDHDLLQSTIAKVLGR